MVGGSLRLLPPLNLVAMIYKCSWNIAESGIKHKKSINQTNNWKIYFIMLVIHFNDSTESQLPGHSLVDNF